MDFGVSPLHTKLKVFDYLLNLGKKIIIFQASKIFEKKFNL